MCAGPGIHAKYLSQIAAIWANAITNGAAKEAQEREDAGHTKNTIFFLR
jgi:hypothetical protein